MSSDQPPMEEKARTCPSCRTPISVLASKCKFCGEVVGKPKEETRSLSINDLGGETVHHRALSNSVMDALESFRIEDEQSATEGDGYAGLEEFDSPQEDSEFDKYDRTASMVSHKAESSTGDRIALVAKVAIAIIVIGGLAVKAPGLVKSMFEEPSEAKVEVYLNEAPGIIKTDGYTIEALKAAIEATQKDPGPENSKLADEVLDMIIKDIEALLNDRRWTTDKLRNASRLATQIVDIYPSSKSTAIKSEVDKENIDYRMFLVSINRRAKTVDIQLSSAGRLKKTYEIDDQIAGRFELTSISGSSSIKLKDKKRNNRILTCKIAKSPS